MDCAAEVGRKELVPSVVSVFAFILIGKALHTALTTQYRATTGKLLIEAAGGIIYPPERLNEKGLANPQAGIIAGARELREETGISIPLANFSAASPELQNNCAFSSASMVTVSAEFRMASPKDFPPQKLDKTEFVERNVFPVKGLYRLLVGECASLLRRPSETPLSCRWMSF